MAAPFGFSAGDIFMALKLVGQVANALKETGGAASDYREVLQYLEGLLLTLQHLQRLDASCADPSLKNAVRALTAAAEQPVKDFVGEMSKYENAMASSHSISGGFKKAQWAVFAAKKAQKLRERIVAQMDPVHLLLGSEALQNFDSVLEMNKSLQQSVDGHASQQIIFNNTLLNSLAALQKTVESANAQWAVPGAGASALDETLTTAPPSSLTELRGLGQQLCVVLLQLLRDIQYLITLLMIASPGLLLQLKVLYQAMVRAPGWLLDDNIHFENALGEMRSLPFTYFKHMRVFKAFLEADFKDKPGELQVLLHHYQILSPSGVRLNGSRWTKIVRPGGHIHMSINIPRKLYEIMPWDDSSPKTGTVVQRRSAPEGAIWEYKTCPHCGLQFFAMSKRSTPESSENIPTLILQSPAKRTGKFYPAEVGHTSPQHPHSPERQIRRLLTLEGEAELPFRRMHIFGGTARKSQSQDRLHEISAAALAPEVSFVTAEAGGGTVDLSYDMYENNYRDTEPIRSKGTSLASLESVYEEEDRRIRCDDSRYHIRPILSMVTISKKVKSWFSTDNAIPKEPVLQTLTCQFVNCARKFDGWKSLMEHLKDDHQLGELAPVIPPSRPSALSEPHDGKVDQDASSNDTFGSIKHGVGVDNKMVDSPSSGSTRLPYDITEYQTDSHSNPVRKEPPELVETIAGSLDSDFDPFDDDDYSWCPS